MVENIDLFYSLRSSYSYLALDRIIGIKKKYDVKISMKLVLPLAVRKRDYFTQLPNNRRSYGVLDNIRIAEYFNIPFQWPDPDPVKFSNGVPNSDQPIAYKISRLGILANGCFFGSGMLAAPEAELDNGMLDLLMLKEISLAKFLWHLPKIYKGTHLKIPEVFFQKVRRFTASSTEQIILDIDGESPGYLEATFEVLPRILKLII